MTLTTHTTSAERHVESGFLQPLFRPLADIVARVRRYNEYARAEAQLLALSEHELADIGITRDVIHQRVWADFSRR